MTGNGALDQKLWTILHEIRGFGQELHALRADHHIRMERMEDRIARIEEAQKITDQERNQHRETLQRLTGKGMKLAAQIVTLIAAALIATPAELLPLLASWLR